MRLATRDRYLASLAAAAFALSTGCSHSPYDAKASGRVTLDGEAVKTGVVTFATADPQAQPAIGQIESGGSFTMKTGNQVGLVSGDYVVAVQSYKTPQGVQPGERLTTSEPGVPARYFRTDTSGLRFAVKPGANTINLELTTAEPAN